ncbi:MAG: hypothetical protein WC119_00460 [Synergistaceae bacterium]
MGGSGVKWGISHIENLQKIDPRRSTACFYEKKHVEIEACFYEKKHVEMRELIERVDMD